MPRRIRKRKMQPKQLSEDVIIYDEIKESLVMDVVYAMKELESVMYARFDEWREDEFGNGTTRALGEIIDAKKMFHKITDDMRGKLRTKHSTERNNLVRPVHPSKLSRN